ncbi:hypothetical protein ACVII0_001651 [Sinorhizobium meliloti]
MGRGKDTVRRHLWRAVLQLMKPAHRTEFLTVPIDVGPEQAERFGMAQSGHRYQPEQAVICPASQGVGRRQRQCCRQKRLNLDLAIDVGLCPPRRRYSVAWWNFRQRIEMSEVLGKAAHISQSDGPTRLPAHRGDPLHCQISRDGLGAAGFHESDELRQSFCRTVIFVSQPLAHADVALKRGAKPAHWTPPGQGRLSSRSFSISSLA